VNVERKYGGTMLPRIRDDDEAALVLNTAEGLAFSNHRTASRCFSVDCQAHALVIDQ
jgi:hypothetical protein